MREIAKLQIAAGQEAAFEAAVAKAVPLFEAAKGCRGMRVARSVEEAGRYWLFVEWDSLEDHTVGFRESQAFADWRALVGPFFAAPPEVEHGAPLALGF